MSTAESDGREDSRKKRVKLIKRIIVGMIVFSIILPTILCIILFIRVNSLDDKLENIQAEVQSFLTEKVQNDSNRHAAVSEEPVDKETAPAGTETGVNTGTSEDPVIETEEAESFTVMPETETEAESETETTTASPEAYDEQELIKEALAEGRKVVYLTFDDGPSENTEKLLDVIDRYGVKVTFFVNGIADYPDSLKRIVQEGHTLALHTYSHDYNHVYGSLEGFKNEVTDIQDKIESITGIRPHIFRFPGGSSNSVTLLPIRTFIDYLDASGIVYYDWNVSSGDGSGGLSANQVYDNVMNGIDGNNVSVVLMHDSVYRMSTYEAVPRIIERLQEMDALILPITDDTVPVHHNVK